MTPPFVVTTSWDDGHPSDLKVADLLAKYGLAGTFYVPNRNIEGRNVMSQSEIRVLARGFELGGHTCDHRVLVGLQHAALNEQIGSNRAWLQDTLGQEVAGFCYVRGRFDTRVRSAVQQAGFSYARTVRNLCCGSGFDPFQTPTTLQFYPHARSVYLRNYLQNGGGDPVLLLAALSTGNFEKRFSAVLDAARSRGNHMHLWGHSWELDEFDLWADLETTFQAINRSIPDLRAVNNAETVALLSAARSP